MNERQVVRAFLKTTPEGVPLFTEVIYEDGWRRFDWANGFSCEDTYIHTLMQSRCIELCHTVELKSRKYPIKEKTVIYRLFAAELSGIQSYGIEILEDGSLEFIWAEELFQTYLDFNPCNVFGVEESRRCVVMNFKEKRRVNPCALPFKASHSQYEEAFVSLFAILDDYTNNFNSEERKKKTPDLRGLESYIEYLGEGEPWVENSDYTRLQRFIGFRQMRFLENVKRFLKTRESPVVYRLYWRYENGSLRCVCNCLQDGSVNFTWSADAIDKHNRSWFFEERCRHIIAEFKNVRKKYWGLAYRMPYKASKFKYRKALISLYAICFWRFNSGCIYVDLNLEKYRTKIEYLGERKPWIDNPAWEKRRKSLKQESVFKRVVLFWVGFRVFMRRCKRPNFLFKFF